MQAAAPRSGYQAAVRKYSGIALVLAVVTLMEWAIAYVPGMQMGILTGLLVLGVLKFVMVAMYFMHLKEDNRLYWMFFAGGVFTATVVTVSLAVLMNVGHVGMKM